MSTTFNFEEIDAETRGYLIAVRDARGAGSPGVFVETGDALPGAGLILGPVVVIVTLLCTLTDWLGVVYDEPLKVACLQTAGLLLGGWLFAAGFRGKGNKSYAGSWVYADPLNLYQAYRETVTVTPIEDVEVAKLTHNYNNGNYQNSVLRVSTGRNAVTAVTLPSEVRAEQMAVYLNYLAWARGAEGGERADLPAATLGGLARYVVKNDHEPLDAESNLNLNLIELEITEVPAEPSREGAAAPSVLPYAALFAGAVAAYLLMAFVVNPPLRDDAIFEAETKEPYVEPVRLRLFYLLDARNTRHRAAATARVARFYAAPIEAVRAGGTDPVLREGMAQILKSVSTAVQPVVSVRVAEKGTPAGAEDARARRESELRTQFVTGVVDDFSSRPWGQRVRLADGSAPGPPLGQQLIEFVEQPKDAPAAHFEIEYTFEPVGDGALRVAVRVDLRTRIEDPPIASSTFDLQDKCTPGTLDTVAGQLKTELLRRMVSAAPGAAPVGAPPAGGF